MPDYKTVTGLTLRTVDYQDYHRILTILTEEMGLVTVVSHGCRSYTSPRHAASQIMVYGQFTLSGKGGRYSLVEADLRETFSMLRTDVEAYGYGMLFLEEAASLSAENDPQPALLSLVLNALFLLDKKNQPGADKPSQSYPQIKLTFELRAAFLSGFCPDLTVCAQCGGDGSDTALWLDVENGSLLCEDCKAQREEEAPPGRKPPLYALSVSALTVLRYLASAPSKRVFAFAVDGETERALAVIAEEYLKYHSEKTYRCLSFFREILGDPYAVPPENVSQ